MSRSYRHTPITGFTFAKSEKRDKQLYNRKYRRKVKQCMHCENYNFPQLKEIANLWNMSKDGKQYISVYSMLKRWKWLHNYRLEHNYNGKYNHEQVNYLKLWYRIMAK